MKVKEARELLAQYSGDELYKKAHELFRQEVDNLIALRWHSGESPSAQNLEGVLDQVSGWFRKVSPGLAWSDDQIAENLIVWERGEVYAHYKVLDPKLIKWRDRVGKERRKGKPFTILDVMKEGDLEAASAFMLGRIVDDAKKWKTEEEKRKAFLDNLGKKPCLYGVDARDCPFQQSFSMVELPRATSDIASACELEPDGKCLYRLKK